MRVLGFMLSAAVVVAQEVDDTAYLLQTRTQQQKSGDVEDCYVTGGCSTTAATEAPTTTTTEAPTTTTARPTRPATTTPRPTRPTTTTTTTPKPPPVGMHVEVPPGKKEEGFDDYCTTGTKLKLSKPSSNNLGGMGPKTTDAKEMRYKNVATTADGKAVNLVITTDGTYYKKNLPKTFRSGSYTQTGKTFISKYNGGGPEGRSDVMAIGSLEKGAYTFNFKFENDAGEAVVIDYLPMTFFDLDGSTRVRGKSYEEVVTVDAAATLFVTGTHVKHSCVDVGDVTTCSAQGAKVEVDIPANFDHLTAATKRAAITFFFKGKSSFDIKYTLNWDHRVFLFKGQCINSD